MAGAVQNHTCFPVWFRGHPGINCVMPPAFHAFGFSHITVVALTLATIGLMLNGRRRGHTWTRPAEVALGWAVFSSHFLAVFFWWMAGIPLTWENVLPMHLCNWAGFAVWLALVYRIPQAAECAWFWAMSGTIQGMITPNQPFDWPHPSFFTFFLLHAGVMIGAVHGVFGMGLRPRPGAWWRGILWTQGYAIAAGVVNVLTGANYAFLREKPAKASLMDHLGPWPWYVVVIHVIGAVLIVLLALPFERRARQREKQPLMDTDEH